jgi:hypothetical protein
MPGFGNSAGKIRKAESVTTPTVQGPRRILWQNVITVLSAAVLIGAEVFGAAFAGGWAVAQLPFMVGLFDLFGLSAYSAIVLQGLFFLLGLYVMAQFVRASMQIEPFTKRG